MHFFKENDLSREEDKYIRFIAYDTLIDFDEKSLPVLSEFDHFINSSILILPMQYVARKGGHEEDYYSSGGKGIVMYVSATEHYIILYDEQMPDAEIRWTLSKLLYLVKSGIAYEKPDVFHYADRPNNEIHCEAFAYQFTCPDAILAECKINSASNIIEHCKIPFSYANIKSKLLETSTRIKSLQLAEKTLINNFQHYIKNFKLEHQIKLNKI